VASLVNVGLYFDLRNPRQWRRPWTDVYAQTIELCVEADHLGIHSIWLSEHHLFDDGYLPQPLTYAAAIAARTKRARIGTAILTAPFRPAPLIAEEAAIVDLVSGGRLELGLGAGYRQPEFELFGADISARYTTTDRRVRELRAIWAAGQLTPPPAQPRIPIWLGYLGPKGARRAGRLGEGLLATAPALVQPYLEGLAEGGHDCGAARMAGAVDGFVTLDPERDWPVVREHLRHQWDSYRRYMTEGTDQPPPRPIDPDKWRRKGAGPPPGHFLYGEPEHVAAEIRRYVRGTPVDTIWLWGSIAGMNHERAAAHVRLVCERLAPLLRERTSEEHD
jgi:alkanesulfonate monooxygenase SsuD/methylene tetrahydromethanopterin reductase-like flavin-dependent oxidoreductase (luciferase family)